MFLHYWPLVLACSLRRAHILCCIGFIAARTMERYFVFGDKLGIRCRARVRHPGWQEEGRRIDSPWHMCIYVSSLNQSADLQRDATRRPSTAGGYSRFLPADGALERSVERVFHKRATFAIKLARLLRGRHGATRCT